MAAQRLSYGIILGELLTIILQPDPMPLTDSRGSSSPFDETHTPHYTQGPSAFAHDSTGNRGTTRPYATVSYRKTPRPSATYSPDIHVVEERCRNGGGEEAAVAILHTLFSNGVSETELTRKVSEEEARMYCGTWN